MLCYHDPFVMHTSGSRQAVRNEGTDGVGGNTPDASTTKESAAEVAVLERDHDALTCSISSGGRSSFSSRHQIAHQIDPTTSTQTHVAKKAVKFETYSSSPGVRVDDDVPFVRQSVVRGEPGVNSSTVSPLTNSKKVGRRYSADDCGVTITYRTELRRAQVEFIPCIAVTGTWHVGTPCLFDVIAEICHCSPLRTKGCTSPWIPFMRPWLLFAGDGDTS